MKTAQSFSHCCSEMRHFLDEKKVAIGYIHKTRSYHINLLTSGGLQEIHYCPWCGKKLPENLREKYCDILENLGYYPFDEDIPDIYKTDEWWRNDAQYNADLSNELT